MKNKTMMFFLICFFLSSCASQNDLVLKAIKNDSFTDIQNKTMILGEVVFDDWAYPNLDSLQELFPENEEYWDFGYDSMKYHGVKIVINDPESLVWEHNDEDDSYTYIEGDSYKIIAFFPREDTNLVEKFKRLYGSKKDIRLKGQFLFLLPGTVWTDTQVREDDMPVMIIKSVRG